jgi:hypothetical protein
MRILLLLRQVAVIIYLVSKKGVTFPAFIYDGDLR